MALFFIEITYQFVQLEEILSGHSKACSKAMCSNAATTHPPTQQDNKRQSRSYESNCRLHFMKSWIAQHELFNGTSPLFQTQDRTLSHCSWKLRKLWVHTVASKSWNYSGSIARALKTSVTVQWALHRVGTLLPVADVARFSVRWGHYRQKTRSGSDSS